MFKVNNKDTRTTTYHQGVFLGKTPNHIKSASILFGKKQ